MRLGLVLIAVLTYALALFGLQPATDASTNASSPAPLYLSPTGSDASPCSAEAPCASFDHAYRRALPGQPVELLSGTYTGQVFNAAPRVLAGRVVFRPAPGATATVAGEVRTSGQNNLEFRDLTIGDYYVAHSDNVVFRNVNTRFFFIRASSNVKIVGGSVGGIDDSTSPTIGTYAGQSPSTNVVIDGVLFHDITRARSPSGHVECLFVQETDGLVIRNSRFTHCDIMDLYFSNIVGGTNPTHVLVENNLFDAPTGGGFYAINYRWDDGETISDVVIRYNSLDGTLRLTPGTYTNVAVYANIGRINVCSPGVRFSYNVWVNQKCARTDRVAATGFLDPQQFNLRLNRRAAGINRGDPKRFPRRDIVGTRRPKGKRPDAGAYEIR